MASLKNQTVHAGHSIYLRMGGQIIGRVQGLNARTSFGTEGVYEIGSIMPQEHIPLRFECTITANKYLIKKKSLVAIGITSVAEDILTKEIFDIVVQDKQTDEVVRVYVGVTQVDGNSNAQANQIVGEDATFVCLEVRKGSVEDQPSGVEIAPSVLVGRG